MDNAALDAWKKDAEWQSDEEVAYHEAGHAVVAHALGDRIEDITIESIEYGDGVQRGLTRHWREGTPLKKLEDELQTAQAGWLATKIAFDSVIGRADDRRRIARAFEEYGAHWSDEERLALRRRGLAGALAILDFRWPAVKALAAALVEQRSLSGAEVHRIIEEAPADLRLRRDRPRKDGHGDPKRCHS